MFWNHLWNYCTISLILRFIIRIYANMTSANRIMVHGPRELVKRDIYLRVNHLWYSLHQFILTYTASCVGKHILNIKLFHLDREINRSSNIISMKSSHKILSNMFLLLKKNERVRYLTTRTKVTFTILALVWRRRKN